MLRLRSASSSAWLEAVGQDLIAFLQDHAANERKVSGSALRLAVQYPSRSALVNAMVGLAREELEHFTRVYRLLTTRGATLAQDAPDPYMTALRRLMRKRDVEEYLLDRLIIFGVVEARACERFTLLGRSLPDAELRHFYRSLARVEARHHGLFLRLAHGFACCNAVATRLADVLDAEAEILARLPIRAALH
jgi:tRNA-(ms[2]io[6]A)-hydroxylase